jgi:flagellar motility protein MotE (MotC chaperone)
VIPRLRLTDAVAIGAGALLVVKVIGLAGHTQASDGGRANSQNAPGFAHALTYALTNPAPRPDPKTTGNVDEDTALEAKSPNGELRVAPPAAPVSSAERALLERLGQRREEWREKGKDLEMRERLLENAERKLESRINELKQIESKAEAQAAKRGDTEDGALRNLVTMYEAMKPKEAARVFDRLPHDVLVPVVLRMNPRKMSEILAVMSTEAAEKLTIALATRGRERTEVATPAAAALPANELPAFEAPKP